MKYEILPKKYWKRHDYLLYVYDVLADMLRQADSKDLSQTNIEFNNEQEMKDFEQCEDIHLWLDENGYHEKSLEFFRNHVFFSLLTDFCYYIYESISCAERGKVTVAYSLLRKPVRDNLLYMEWLLANTEEVYQAVLYEDIRKYDISNWDEFSRGRIKKIIKQASEKTYMGKGINSDNLVYTFRFNSKDEIGLQRIWNQSMHLVTTSNNYKTEKSNLNFIFADEEIWDDYWNYYYLVIPQIMAYTLEICEANFLNTVKVDDFNIVLNRSIRSSKYFKVYSYLEESDLLKDMPKDIYELLKEGNARAYIKCEGCGSKIVVTKELLKLMVDEWYIVCKSCNENHSICRYYTDFKVEENSISLIK